MFINFEKIKSYNISCFELKRLIWAFILFLFIVFFVYLSFFSYRESRQIFKYQTRNTKIYKDVDKYSESLDLIIGSMLKKHKKATNIQESTQ